MRRGSDGIAAKKKSRVYTVRREQVMDAPRGLKEHNPYYADVVPDPSRLSDIVEGAAIPGVKDMKPVGFLPEDMGPARDQVAPGFEVAEAAFETGGMLLPEIAHDFQSDVRKLLDSDRPQIAAGKKHVEFAWPSADPNPVPGSRARGFFCMHFPGYSQAGWVAF